MVPSILSQTYSTKPPLTLESVQNKVRDFYKYSKPHFYVDKDLMMLKNRDNSWVVIDGHVYETTNLSVETWKNIVEKNYDNATEESKNIDFCARATLLQYALGPYFGTNVNWYEKL